MTSAPTVRVSQTPGGALTTSAAGSGLPRDLLAVATRRLGILALVTCGVVAVNLLVAHVLAPTIGNDWPVGGALDVLGGVAIALSLLVYQYTRRTKADPLRVIYVGLTYEVALCAVTAMLGHYFYDFYKGAGHGPQLSWVCPFLVFFPAMVPSTPGRTAVAALLGASMDPLFMAISLATGRFDAPAGYIFWMHFPNYVCAGLGILVSHIITNLGRQVRDARDLGSYRLGALLGEGGMGAVYRADHRLLARPAAIKLIRPETQQWSGDHGARLAVERFTREAHAAAALRSPHTIDLYDFGVTDDGTFYIVMELLDGIDLASFVTRFGPMPAARAIHVVRQACDSLSEAHARDLVHRDVKPANLHLCRLGLRHDFVKVLDFGLVKPRRSEQLASGAVQTATDMVAGTPAFMAPEAAMGAPLDGRADVYGLGCVAYWLLTGRLVFDAPTPFQVLTRHLEETPVPPSRLSEWPVSPAVDAAVLACLAKSPTDRPDADGLAGLLDACAAAEPWTAEQARRWWDTHLPSAEAPAARLAAPTAVRAPRPA